MNCLVCHMPQSGPHKMDCRPSERNAAERRQETRRGNAREREEAHSKALVRARNEGLEMAAREADAAAGRAEAGLAMHAGTTKAFVHGAAQMAVDLAVLIRRKKEPEQ